MKKTGLQMTIKYLLAAIILGCALGNLLCVLEVLSNITTAIYNIDLELILTLLSYASVYIIFIQAKKTVYALVCIPSVIYFVSQMLDFWGRVFHQSISDMYYIRLGTGMSLYFSILWCVILVLATLLIRRILIRRGKLLDFEETVEGYCVELRSLLFVCGRKDKYYKKQIRALADAYHQKKEKDIIAYMIHQEEFIRVYGEITEDEMLVKIEDMFFMPRIFLHKELCGTIVFTDEINAIEISFEGMFENFCYIIIEDYKFEI